MPLQWSEEIKYIVWLQQFMYSQIHGTHIYIYIYTIDVRENTRYV